MRGLTKLCSIVVVAAGMQLPASADYDRRLEELNAEIANATPRINAVDESILKRFYKEYIDMRNAKLREMLEVMARTENAEQVNNFRNPLFGAVSILAGQNASGLKKNLSPAAANIHTAFSMSEEALLLRLLKTELPQRRDEIIKAHAELVALTKSNEERWSNLLTLDASYDEQEKAIARDVKRIVEEVIAEVAETNKGYVEKIREWGGRALTLTPLAQLSMFKDLFVGYADIAVEKLEAKQRYVIKRMEDYRSLVNYEKNGIAALYQVTSKDTNEFIEKNGFVRAQAVYTRAKEQAELLYGYDSGKLTSGQIADMTEFSQKLLKHLSDHLAAIQTTHNAFVVDKKLKFFGPIGPNLEEDLVERRFWEQTSGEVQQLNLQSRLREWRSRTPTFVIEQIDMLSGLTPEHRQAIKNIVHDSLKGILDDIEAVANGSAEVGVFNPAREDLARALK